MVLPPSSTPSLQAHLGPRDYKLHSNRQKRLQGSLGDEMPRVRPPQAVWQAGRLVSERKGTGKLSRNSHDSDFARSGGQVRSSRATSPLPLSATSLHTHVPAHIREKYPGNKFLFPVSPFQLRINTRDEWNSSSGHSWILFCLKEKWTPCSTPPLAWENSSNLDSF